MLLECSGVIVFNTPLKILSLTTSKSVHGGGRVPREKPWSLANELITFSLGSTQVGFRPRQL